MILIGTSTAIAGLGGDQHSELLFQVKSESSINQGPGFVDEIQGTIITGSSAFDTLTIAKSNGEKINIHLMIPVLLGFYKEIPRYGNIVETLFSAEMTMDDLLGKELVRNQEFKDIYHSLLIHSLAIETNETGIPMVVVSGEITYRNHYMILNNLPAIHQTFTINELLITSTH